MPLTPDIPFDFDDEIPGVLQALSTHLGMQVAFMSSRQCGQHVMPPFMTQERQKPLQETGERVCVPVVLADGEVYGTLCCLTCPNTPAEQTREVQVLQAFAQLVAGRVEQIQNGTRLHDEQRSAVEQVLALQEFQVQFQPVMSLDTLQPVGFEALSRFGAVPHRTPDVWFAQAWKAGLGVDLECAVCLRAVHDFKQASKGGFLAVNCSPATVLSAAFQEVLERFPLERLVIEITEHTRIENHGVLRGALQEWHQSGLRVAVDDAGAGYASMQHVLQLQPDIIKLDMGLTRDINQSQQKQALTASLVTYAQHMHVQLVAEGIETPEELHTLQKLGVAYGQGYLMGRPGPLELPA